MTFVSLPFLLFVAGTALLYFLFPLKIRWTVLLAASGLYYYLNCRELALVLLGTTLVTYLLGLAIAGVYRRGERLAGSGGYGKEEKKRIRDGAKRKAKVLLWIGVLLDLGTLLFLKYHNFFAENANRLLETLGLSVRIPGHGFLLPLGISYYTLQAIGYLADVTRRKCEADRNPFRLLLFMSFFPQILQGPIPRYGELAGQLYEGHPFDHDRMCRGLELMLWGWFQKLVIADRAAIPVRKVFDDCASYEGPVVLLAVALLGVQMYADFAGGIDVARGIAEILGVELEANFRQPYFATSVEDFWRRWHVTLGTWMRDYVFYPLSLSKAFTGLGRRSRKVLGPSAGKRLPALLAMLLVYLLVGFWHGPDWKYVLYGLWNSFFIMAGILLEEPCRKARELAGIDGESLGWRIFQAVRTFLILSAGRIVSEGKDLASSLTMYRNLFVRWWDLSFLLDGSLEQLGLDAANWNLLWFCVLLLFAADLLHEREFRIRDTVQKQHFLFRWIVLLLAVLAILVFGIYGPSYDAASFLYEQF